MPVLCWQICQKRAEAFLWEGLLITAVSMFWMTSGSCRLSESLGTCISAERESVEVIWAGRTRPLIVLSRTLTAVNRVAECIAQEIGCGGEREVSWSFWGAPMAR